MTYVNLSSYYTGVIGYCGGIVIFGFGSMLKDYLEYHKISQSDFASRLGITQKHINNILNKSADISEDLMLAISLITDIDVNLIAFVEAKKKLYNYLNNKFGSEKEIEKFLSSYHLNEMSERGWIVLNDRESYLQNAYDLLKFLNVKDFDVFENYSNSKILYKKKEDADLKKVFLWITRCDNLVKKQEVNRYNSSNLDKLLLELKSERMNKFNPNKLIELFNKYGIYLVIEDALTATKMRGCTKVFGNNPAIYMTTYLNEKSSFYFALYHELSHVKTNYNKAKSKVIIDGEDEIEKRADAFAINQMISEKIYNEIMNNYYDREIICKREKIPLCFLYSRLAKEEKIKYNDKLYINNREPIEY